MTGFIGQSLLRFEDQRFVTGEGQYSDDLAAPGAAHLAIVRSPHGHALIEAVDVGPARGADGVLAFYSAADLETAGVRPISSANLTPPFQCFNADGSQMIEASQPVLARDRVRYVGEPVAAVVAETAQQARAAAELVDVRYAELAAATSLEAARAEDAEPIWPEHGSNRSCFWDEGDGEKTDALFAQAAHVVTIETGFPRSFVTFMEPRGGIAEYDTAAERFLIRVGCQSAHRLRDDLADCLDVPAERIRVQVPDVGGGFGARGVAHAEPVLALLAARDLGRTVRYVMERAESFLIDGHARSHRFTASLAMDAEGRFLAYRLRSAWCHGAYFASRSVYVVNAIMGHMMCGPYRFQASHFALDGYFTNTAPTVSYRGVSRAEAGYILERLVEKAARETGIDRIDLRRRNLIQPEEMPWTTPSGHTYGRAEMPEILDEALEAADWEGFEGRRTEALARGRLLGRAASAYIVSAGGTPNEYARVAVTGNGAVTAHVGTQDFGMSHETVFAQVLADRLGTAPDAVTLVQGDTETVPQGAGGQASRCLRIGSGALLQAAEEVIAQGTAVAEDLLEAAGADISFEAGHFTVAGTDRSVSLAEVAQAADTRGAPLVAAEVFVTERPAFPNGAHVCEVEVDPDTGAFEIKGFTGVIDPGTVVNPMIAEGQMHGAIAQGIGEGAVERVVYDGSGQLLSGSFMDFALPRADDLPSFTTVFHPLANDDNPLGVKGIGEMGTVVTPAVVINAVVDALRERGVAHLEMPVTQEAVWRALNGSEA